MMMKPRNTNIGGSMLATAIGYALSSSLGPTAAPSKKRTEQKVNVKTMSNRQRDMYEKSLRRKARQEKQG